MDQEQQDLWDQEDDSAFRRKLRELQLGVALAEEAERKARGEAALAIRARREAELRLRQFVEADARPLPLFDRAKAPESALEVAQPAQAPPAPAAAPDPVEPRCACCLGLASHLERGQSFDAQGLCPDCVGAVMLGEADTGQGRLTVWSLLCGTAWAWGPFAQLGNWSRADLANDQYAPSVERIAEVVSALAGRVLACVDWWPLDSLGLMVIRLAPSPAPPRKRKAVKP